MQMEMMIAERKLHTPSGSEVLVRIGMPVPDEGDFSCPYEIEIGGRIKKGRALGMDAVQALQLALARIGMDLEAASKQIGEPISWLKDEPGVTGFS